MKKSFKIAIWVGVVLMILGTLGSMHLGDLIAVGAGIGAYQLFAVLASVFSSVGIYFGASLTAGAIVAHLVVSDRDISDRDS